MIDVLAVAVILGVIATFVAGRHFEHAEDEYRAERRRATLSGDLNDAALADIADDRARLAQWLFLGLAAATALLCALLGLVWISS